MTHRWSLGPAALRSCGLRGAAILALTLAGCGPPPPLRTIACHSAPLPEIVPSPDGKTKSATLTVLTYNIEGLGFPVRRGRSRELREIGARLSAMGAAGTAPDIVLFQEMFSGAAKRAVMNSGYDAIAPGPTRTTKPFESTRERLPGKAKLKRGEIGLRLTGSGLAIASRYPIVSTDMRAYGARSCAGVDCLSNKGVMLARIYMPGVPTPIDVYNTHMNSRGPSRTPEPRNRAAHERQALEASEFIDATHDDGYPIIFGGDFNMRNSEPRWESFSYYQPLALVHRLCVDESSGCDVEMSWDGDAPWMDTQDLQFFWSGTTTSIRPVRVEAMFDGSAGSPRLSDHDGLLVTYRLEWPADRAEQDTILAGCGRFR